MRPDLITDQAKENILAKLEKSSFRKRFYLGERLINYYNSKGYDLIKEHAFKLVANRIAPATIYNDGRQTPMKNHPVFVAQHATATCCRECIAKWHGIGRDKQLDKDEINYIVDIIMRWIVYQINKRQI